MANVKEENQTPFADLKEDKQMDIDPPLPKSKRKINLTLLHFILKTVHMMGIIRTMAVTDLGLDFSVTFDDVAALKLISEHSLSDLKYACKTKKIKHFLQSVFLESGAAYVLGEGNFTWEFFINKMSLDEYGCYSQIAATKEERILIWKMFAEELDPMELFGTLQQIKLVGEKHKTKMKPEIPRKDRVDFLIGRLVRKKGPDEGFKILLAHCVKNEYEFIWKINDIFGGDARNSNFRRKGIGDESLPGQLLFTAIITLSIHGSKGARNTDLDIQDHKWYDNPEKMHQCVLNRCLLALVKDLDVKLVCMYIQQREVLDEVTVRDVMEQPITSDRIMELIKRIQQRDSDIYEKFKECLVLAKQEVLKDMLEKEEAIFAKEKEEEEIIIMGLKPNWESTEEKVVTKEKQHLKRKRSMHTDDTASSVPYHDG